MVITDRRAAILLVCYIIHKRKSLPKVCRMRTTSSVAIHFDEANAATVLRRASCVVRSCAILTVSFTTVDRMSAAYGVVL